jgi:hypothetical protein
MRTMEWKDAAIGFGREVSRITHDMGRATRVVELSVGGVARLRPHLAGPAVLGEAVSGGGSDTLRGWLARTALAA